MKKNLLLTAAMLLCLSTFARANALSLTNYQTDYRTVDGSKAMSCWDEGTVALAGSADPCHPLWETGGDYDGDGQMVLVNSSVVRPGSRVAGWSVATQPGQSYTWSTWLKNLYDGPRAVVGFYVDGQNIGNGYLGAAGIWFDTILSFVSAGDQANLELREETGIEIGADWAFDDPNVTATPAPEVSTMLQLGTGLLGLGAMVRRRSHAAVMASARAVWQFIRDERGGSLNL